MIYNVIYIDDRTKRIVATMQSHQSITLPLVGESVSFYGWSYIVAERTFDISQGSCDVTIHLTQPV